MASTKATAQQPSDCDIYVKKGFKIVDGYIAFWINSMEDLISN